VTPEQNSSVGVWSLGLVALLAACGASGMLAAEHLGLFGRGLPGCGPGSGCDSAAKSVYGSLPFEVPWGVGKWPVSFAGFAFFLAMLGAWLVSGRRVPALVTHMARLGALASGFFIFIMLTHMNQYFCKYCAASHASNLVFWVCAEVATRAGLRRTSLAAAWKALATAAVVFLGSSVAMGVADKHQVAAAQQEAEDDLSKEIAAMQAAAAQQAAPKPEAPKAEAPKKKDYPPIDIGLPIPGDETLKQEGLIGRYRLGPAESSIRVVIFSDYQCRDCARIEKEMREILKAKPYILFSAKQYAFCKDCNKYYDGNMHPNACWAARAAEAAGILRGNAGFWQMHFWLYDRKSADGQEIQGSFTSEELREALLQMGYDPAEFEKVMGGDESLKRLTADIDEGMTYGLFGTPMIFVNGREFRAWNAPNALARYIEAVEKTNPPVASTANDAPSTKLDKGVEDWRQWPRTNLARVSPVFPKGPGDAKVRIVMYGDAHEDFTQKLWKVLGDLVKNRSDVQIDYRPRPVGQACNVMGADPKTIPACRMARALEAAGRLGGADAYWKMLEWQFQVGKGYTEEMLPEAAKAAGLDAAKLKDEMDGPDVLNLMIENQKMFQRSGARGVPSIFVNERLVIRWNIDNIPILDRIISAAAEGK